MRTYSHHVPTFLSVGSAALGLVAEASNEVGSHLGGLVALGGLVFAIFSHFSKMNRLESENQQLRIELAAVRATLNEKDKALVAEKATSTAKDHRIAFSEAVILSAPAAPPTATPEPPKPEIIKP